MKEGRIIALQELCDWWEPSLNVHFINNNYHLISRQYSNGKLGVGIAYPKDIYELVQYNVFNTGLSYHRILIDGLSMQKITKQEKTTHFNKQEIDSTVSHLNEGTFIESKCISIKLRHRNNPTREFWVSTYHMPCKYDKLIIMYSHLVSVMSHLKSLTENLPIIFMGDLNIVPDSESYDILVKRIIPKDLLKLFKYSGNRSYPFKSSDSDFDPTDRLITFSSAYKDINSSEPDYTNVCITSKKKFIETLDYIFYSGVVPVKCNIDSRVTDHREACDQIPHPTSICASDHFPIIGTFVYPSE
jgi:mRNA deadenylase 3'-5' endonuclease subunit Ccr4